MSRHALDWTPLDHSARDPVRVGDLVSADAGGMPIFQVTALANGRAWLSGEGPAPRLDMPLAAFQWRARGG